MEQLNFTDFYQVPDLKFDINRLRKDFRRNIKKRNFNTLNVTNFGAIPLKSNTK